MDDSPLPFEPLLSIRDTMRALRISRSGVYRLLADGRIEAVKLGSKTMPLTRSVQAHVDALPRATFKQNGPRTR